MCVYNHFANKKLNFEGLCEMLKSHCYKDEVGFTVRPSLTYIHSCVLYPNVLLMPLKH